MEGKGPMAAGDGMRLRAKWSAVFEKKFEDAEMQAQTAGIKYNQ